MVLPIFVETEDNNASNIEIHYPRPITLDANKEYEIALAKAWVWLTVPNITAAKGNNVLQYSDTGAPPFPFAINFPDGNYNISELQNTINAGLVSNGHASNSIFLDVNLATTRVELQLAAGFGVDFTVGTINQLLGFPPAATFASGPGTSEPDLQAGIDRVFLQCNLVHSTWRNDVPTTYIYGFHLAGLPSTQLEVSPNPLVWIPMKDHTIIHRLHLRLVDQDDRQVPLNKAAEYHLLIQEKK